MATKQLTPEGNELTSNELTIMHQQWLQHPETITVLKALRKHADTHTAVALKNATNSIAEPAMVKQQAAIAYNLHLIIDIMCNPTMIHKLLHSADEQTNNQ
jgi:hypothetical protein